MGELAPVVRFSNGCVRVIERHVWQSEEYPSLYISQYPLCLAWALTIHKIQGATMAMAEMDLGNAIFEYGQTYVALSRIQTLDGLYLSAFHPQRIKANPKVRAFYESIPNTTVMKPVEEMTVDWKQFAYVPEEAALSAPHPVPPVPCSLSFDDNPSPNNTRTPTLLRRSSVLPNTNMKMSKDPNVKTIRL
jgi:hypothetical protein